MRTPQVGRVDAAVVLARRRAQRAVVDQRGESIAVKSALDIAEDLQRGTLVALCDARQGEPAPLPLAGPDRGQWRPAVRLLPECIAARFEALQARLPTTARA